MFQRNKSTISRHIKSIFEEGELNREVVGAKYATTTQHGAITKGRGIALDDKGKVGRQDDK